MTGIRDRPRLLRLLALLAVWLILSSSLLVSPVAAQSDTDPDPDSDPCTGMSPGAKWMCDGIMGVIEWFVEGLQELVQGMFTGVIEFVVDTPAPYRNGEMAFFQSPDNAPWASLYDLYLTRTLPIGIVLWTFIVGVSK